MPAPVLAGPRSVVIGGRPGARCFHDTRVLCRVSVSRAPSVLSSLLFPAFLPGLSVVPGRDRC